MKKTSLFLIAFLILLPASLFANEGMWFLMHIKRLNERDMQKMGLQLTAEEIYSINNQSLKDAIVQFNGGCTASIISDNGLVLTNHDSMTEKEREAAINKEIAKIEQENNEGGKYTVSVRSFFQGNEYYYFVYEDYKDVRLVGTPSDKVGKYGGDTDNWEWPRHTGDFSLFRVYADAEGNPAEYSENNVPLKAKYHLPVNIKGVKENDFAMI
eukprot:TRINITY_DN697_c0_g1_i1.p1 TRINITY_DN697_c0_g1~~TRINITY_DN697_c0_g1_i1.p1  ORF type:complete len:212 (+),score=49.94 TRINITY_DN697_c0_g1_i1:77-712(+)